MMEGSINVYTVMRPHYLGTLAASMNAFLQVHLFQFSELKRAIDMVFLFHNDHEI
jgi:hypothetical protein